MVSMVGEKMFHRTKEIRAEPSAFRICAADSAAREQPRKKFLRQFPRRIFIPSFTPKKMKHRLVIRLTQFAQRASRLRRFTTRAQHQRPACRGERSVHRGVDRS